MRVVFMGTPEFAVPSLLALAAADARSSASSAVPTPSPVVARERPALAGQGRRRSSSGCRCSSRPPCGTRPRSQLLGALEPDLIVVAAYGLILPPAVLEAAPLGAVNVHASLLPRWRGAAPIQRAILAGDARDRRLDHAHGGGSGHRPVLPPGRRSPIGDAGAVAAHRPPRAARRRRARSRRLPAIADGQRRVDAPGRGARDLRRQDHEVRCRDLTRAPVEQTLWRRVRASLPGRAMPRRASPDGTSRSSRRARGSRPTSGAPSAGRVACAKAGVLLGMRGRRAARRARSSPTARARWPRPTGRAAFATSTARAGAGLR